MNIKQTLRLSTCWESRKKQFVVCCNYSPSPQNDSFRGWLSRGVGYSEIGYEGFYCKMNWKQIKVLFVIIFFPGHKLCRVKFSLRLKRTKILACVNTRWLECRFRQVSCGAPQGSSPVLPDTLFSTVQLVLYEFALLLCLVVLCTGHRTTETARITKERLATFNN